MLKLGEKVSELSSKKRVPLVAEIRGKGVRVEGFCNGMVPELSLLDLFNAKFL